MSPLPRILPDERTRFVILAVLLFLNSLVLNANEVVATTGFISSVGVEQILLVWALDMMIVIITSSVYSLIVDRTQRERLAVRLAYGFTIVYILLYFFFRSAEQSGLPYLLLLVINDQQWLLFPLVVWTLGTDLFSLDQTKRLFPLLGATTLIGAMVGNGAAAGVATLFGTPSIGLLLVNAGLMLLMALIITLNYKRIKSEAHQSRQGEKLFDALREGIAFVRDVPVFRFLTIAMILMGVALNAVEFQLMFTASETYANQPAELQTFYGIFKLVVVLSIILIQGAIATQLLNRVGFKYIFGLMPAALLASLAIMISAPSIIGVALGGYLTRVVLVGIDEPARKAFQGLVPDERRGRVSAFLDGYLLPFGTILSCGMIGGILIAVNQNLLEADVGRVLYLSIAGMCVIFALVAIIRLHATYDSSMLNWRLRRRQARSVLDKLDF
ncbi:MAG: MFS transporter [Anaerolineaceae bacterium]|nr:MFS transporter [Anaerolineaceae bacterium]